MTEQEKTLREQGFTHDQIAEIVEGGKEQVDTSVYAKKEFLAIQMRQIRLGLSQGLDVGKYARPEYDWFQMEEIRKGLLGGVNVDLFADPSIPYDKMRQIRWGLCDGLDLSGFKHLEVGILRELRLAIHDKVSIVSYISAGYDEEQLEAIREALCKGIDIAQYLDKSYRGISLKEIFLGLEHGVDVSSYAKPEYCWQQMRELRLGLESRVDINRYKNPYYGWQQMRQIRLGLEAAQDVSYFSSFKYTASEMEKRRLALQENPALAYIREDEPHVQVDLTDRCRIEISEDQTQAFLQIIGDSSGLGRADILKALGHMGIAYGVQYDKIDEIAHGNVFRKPVLIAQGLPARHGDDGYYEYFFRTEVARTPKQLPGGDVDYHDVEWFETVKKGQNLAVYHAATDGEDGMTVLGEPIPARRGREECILTGTGFERRSDEKTYRATKTGIISLHGTNLEVSDLIIMDEVNLATGDLIFDGNVLIRGNVGSGAKIRAGADLVIEGFVEAAQIECKGNVLLHQGMNGGGTGYIYARGDIVGCFFEAATLKAEGNIQGDYFLNCDIATHAMLNVTGKKGTLAGGKVYAERGMRAHDLGNHMSLPTRIKIGMVERLAERESEIDAQIRNVSVELCTLGNSHHEFQVKYPPEVRNAMPIYRKIEAAVYTKEKEMEQLMAKRQELEEEKKHVNSVQAVIDCHLYEGVTFEVDGSHWRSKDLLAVTVRREGKHVVAHAT